MEESLETDAEYDARVAETTRRNILSTHENVFSYFSLIHVQSGFKQGVEEGEADEARVQSGFNVGFVAGRVIGLAVGRKRAELEFAALFHARDQGNTRGQMAKLQRIQASSLLTDTVLTNIAEMEDAKLFVKAHFKDLLTECGSNE